MARILVVDDDPDILETLELALGTRYAVVTATDGQEALAVIAREGSSIDLVVLDLMMPRMSGGELVNELRARSLDIPVILSSAAHDLSRRAVELAAADFVAKPFSLRLLRAKIATVLGTDDGSTSGGSEPGSSTSSGGDAPSDDRGTGARPSSHRDRVRDAIVLDAMF